MYLILQYLSQPSGDWQRGALPGKQREDPAAAGGRASAADLPQVLHRHSVCIKVRKKTGKGERECVWESQKCRITHWIMQIEQCFRCVNYSSTAPSELQLQCRIMKRHPQKVVNFMTISSANSSSLPQRASLIWLPLGTLNNYQSFCSTNPAKNFKSLFASGASSNTV